jgi:aspartyl protease family protein
MAKPSKKFELSWGYRVKSSKFRLPWAVLLVLTVILEAAVLPVRGETDVAGLERQLQSAVANSNWPQALQVVERLIPLIPQQASQLKAYRSKLQQLSRSSVATAVKTQTPLLPTGRVAIKRREHGVAVVDVLFNQRKTFEMLVDSGASLTIITRPMASALGITAAQVVDNVTFKTANGQTQLPIVYLNTISVGGLSASPVQVAIAGPEMEIGLLGQDFLQRYDVSMRGNSIEFHDRT